MQHSPPHRKPLIVELLLHALIVVLVCAEYAAVWGSLKSFTVAFDRLDFLFADFQSHYYPAGRAIFRAEGHVWGFAYTPFAALLLAPVSALPYYPAKVVWGLVQLAAIAAVPLVLGLTVLRGSRPLRLTATALVLTSHPVLHGFRWGQVSMLVVLLLVVAGVQNQEKSHGRAAAAALLGLIATIKFFLGVFLLQLAFRVGWRWALASAAAAGVAAFLIPLPLLGPGGLAAYYKAVADFMRVLDGYAPLDINSQFCLYVAGRWMELPAALVAQLERWFVAGGIMLFGGALWFCWRERRAPADRWLLALLAAYATLPFFVKTSWPHYFAHLPVMQVLLVAGLCMLPARSPRAWLVLAATALSVGLSNVFIFQAVGRWESYVDAGMPLIANALALTGAVGLLAGTRAEAVGLAAGMPVEAAP